MNILSKLFACLHPVAKTPANRAVAEGPLESADAPQHSQTTSFPLEDLPGAALATVVQQLDRASLRDLAATNKALRAVVQATVTRLTVTLGGGAITRLCHPKPSARCWPATLGWRRSGWRLKKSAPSILSSW